ncbi:diguanylate cyclase [Desulfosporosinus sp.]|uniref:diguanylate cyclase n=1 Tax=Desulfosporosinus sp. TaxID=157907 RepID=UPI0025B92228|nr:diguanylate cyclase [Desulfosporosinus sp.]MBC2727129.1 diguanylate cyclase [Desulfosporosinus sp.]
MNNIIAIVDDCEDDIFAIKKMILKQNSDYKIVDFTDPEDALVKLRQDKVDCIILDYYFPLMNGLEFIKEFRSYNDDTPIIFLTGQGNENVAAESIQAGAFHYIIKSEISGESLHNCILKGILKSDLDRKERSYNEFIKTMTNIIPVPLFYKDKNGIYLGCNKAFEEFIGLNKDEIIGKTVYDISEKNDAETYANRDRQLLDNPGTTQTYEHEYVNPNNMRKYVIFKKVTYRDSLGNVSGIIGIVNDITEIKERETELTSKTYYDSLTGIFNRRYFDEYVEIEWKKCKRKNEPLCLIMLDIDFFKNYNDTYGHQEGDNCLHNVAQEIKLSLLRPSDIAVRYGGEEFVVILPNTKLNGAYRVAERIRQNIINRGIKHVASAVSDVVTLSQGIAEMSDINDTVDKCLRNADQSLYEAKKNGRNTIRCLSVYDNNQEEGEEG